MSTEEEKLEIAKLKLLEFQNRKKRASSKGKKKKSKKEIDSAPNCLPNENRQSDDLGAYLLDLGTLQGTTESGVDMASGVPQPESVEVESSYISESHNVTVQLLQQENSSLSNEVEMLRKKCSENSPLIESLLLDREKLVTAQEQLEYTQKEVKTLKRERADDHRKAIDADEELLKNRKEIKLMAAETRSLREKLTEYEESGDIKAKFQEVSENLDLAIDELERAKAVVVMKEEEITALKQEKAKLRGECQESKAICMNMASRIKDLSERNAVAASKMKIDHENVIEGLKKNSEALRVKISQLEEAAESSKAEEANAGSRVSELQIEVESLSKDRNAISELLSEEKLARKNLEEELGLKKKDILEFMSQLNEHERVKKEEVEVRERYENEMKQQIQALQDSAAKDKKELEEVIHQMKSRLDDGEQMQSRLLKENQELSNECSRRESVESENNLLTKELSDSKKQIEGLNERILDLQRLLKESNINCEKLESMKVNLISECKKLEEDLRETGISLKVMKESKESSLHGLDQHLRKEMSESMEKVLQDHNSEIAERMSEIGRLSKEKAEIEERMSQSEMRLNKEIGILKEELIASEEAFVKLRNEHDKSIQRGEALTQSLDELNVKLTESSKLEMRIEEDMKNQRDRYDDEVKNLQDKQMQGEISYRKELEKLEKTLALVHENMNTTRTQLGSELEAKENAISLLETNLKETTTNLLGLISESATLSESVISKFLDYLDDERMLSSKTGMLLSFDGFKNKIVSIVELINGKTKLRMDFDIFIKESQSLQKEFEDLKVLLVQWLENLEENEISISVLSNADGDALLEDILGPLRELADICEKKASKDKNQLSDLVEGGDSGERYNWEKLLLPILLDFAGNLAVCRVMRAFFSIPSENGNLNFEELRNTVESIGRREESLWMTEIDITHIIDILFGHDNLDKANRSLKDLGVQADGTVGGEVDDIMPKFFKYMKMARKYERIQNQLVAVNEELVKILPSEIANGDEGKVTLYSVIHKFNYLLKTKSEPIEKKRITLGMRKKRNSKVLKSREEREKIINEEKYSQIREEVERLSQSRQ